MMNFESKQPLVSVGLPVYNRPDLLYRALDCLANQTYRNLEIIISDDCSPGKETQQVVQKFINKDSRIHYYRQEENLGPNKNHKFVFDHAQGDYFFWASEDDEWNSSFVEKGVRALTENSNYHAWCCSLDVIDSFGRVIRKCPGFSRYTSTENKSKDIIRYLLEPEIMGKANILHGIYQKSALNETMKEYFWKPRKFWGTDFCFVLAFLTRFNLLATDEVLLRKRVIGANDSEKEMNPMRVHTYRGTFSLSKSISFIRENYNAVKTTPYKRLVLFIMILRIPLATIHRFITLIDFIGKKNIRFSQ